MADSDSNSTPTPEVGKPFNPFRVFNGVFIPDAIVEYSQLSPGAKIVYGRLTRYAGQNGECFPASGTLAAKVGLHKRQVQNHLSELEREGFIRRIPRFSGKSQTSNGFQFLWHSILGGAINCTGGMQDIAPHPMQDIAHKESQRLKENHLKDKKTVDVDLQHASRKTGDSRQCDPTLAPSHPKKYPELREALADYMNDEPDQERVYPKPRHIVEVMNASGGATEREVIDCLRYLRDERGLRYGTRNGPRHYSWFPTVVGDYFAQRRKRLESADPAAFTPHGKSTVMDGAEFDALTNSI